MADGRVLIASGGDPLAPSPSWDRYDDLPNCRCPGWEMTTGRSSVFERTDVGTAQVTFQDRGGVLDTDALVGRAIQLQIRDPVAATWESSFRGVVDEIEYGVSPTGQFSTVQLNCVDMFAFLSRVGMVKYPLMGHEPTLGNQGSVTYAAQTVQNRMRKLFEDALIPEEMYVAFTGNVWVWDHAYDVGESILNAIRDAADAEFPGIANVYVDRIGRVCFHGRRSRFDPDGTADGADWIFVRWAAGDEAATIADSSRAQVRGFSFTRASSLIYNAAVAWPIQIPVVGKTWAREFPEKAKDDQWWIDDTSKGIYGYRAMPPMGDLMTMRHQFNGNDGAEECRLFARYFVENYKAPMKTIQSCQVKSIHPSDPRAAATWGLLTRMDISDMLNLTIAAGGVTNQDFFVEGFQKTVRVLGPDFDYVEVSPNLTPDARYEIDPFDDA
jgi:hypothetical protein